MNWIIKIGLVLLGLYVLLCIALYFVQEALLFYPAPLAKDYEYQFPTDFEEIKLESVDGVVLSHLHFKVKESKGVVLFFHGNGGSVNDWGNGHPLYINKGYDVVYADYRGYGKSGGKILSEAQLVADAQMLYDLLKKDYKESQIMVSGTSMGTGIATQIASNNAPKHLLLHAPYASLSSLVLEKVPFIPSFIIRYQLESIHHLAGVSCPIALFHGKNDRLIPYAHALRLKEKYEQIDLILLDRCGHGNIFSQPVYLQKMKQILY